VSVVEVLLEVGREEYLFEELSAVDWGGEYGGYFMCDVIGV